MVLTVSDTGIGIDADTATALFQPFTQVDASTTRSFGGTGLGLAISRQLVDLMRGPLDLDSHPGAGTTFRIALPLAVAEAEQRLPAVAASTSVLVLDRDAGSRTSIARLFDDQGCRVTVAAGLDELLGASGHDLVVADPRLGDRPPGTIIATLKHLVDDVPLLLVLPPGVHTQLDPATRAAAPVVFKPIRRRELLAQARDLLSDAVPPAATAPPAWTST